MARAVLTQYNFIQGIGAVTKSAEFCCELAQASIRKAEEQYGVFVIGFISDNEPKMEKLRDASSFLNPKNHSKNQFQRQIFLINKLRFFSYMMHRFLPI